MCRGSESPGIVVQGKQREGGEDSNEGNDLRAATLLEVEGVGLKKTQFLCLSGKEMVEWYLLRHHWVLMVPLWALVQRPYKEGWHLGLDVSEERRNLTIAMKLPP